MRQNLFFTKKRILTWLLVIGASPLFAGTANLISPGASWKYLDNGTDQGVAWYAPAFNDATWVEGASELGYGDGGEATVVSYGPDANNKYVTTYFRKTFNVADASVLKSLLIGIRADDGAVIYINGVEVARQNMPAGPINYTTLAPGNIANHFENVYHHFAISPSSLITGTNVIAVEIHQDDVTSSDLSFNFELIGSTEPTLIARGDDWKYLDDGTDQSTNWKEETFNDAAWLSGKAILGYNSTAGSRIENTTLSYGPDANNKYITTYFRKSITIPDTSLFAQFQLNLLLDDGAVIYVNGVEANRINLPAGIITYTTTAPTAVGTAAWTNYTINKTLFKNGTNVIAVEVHQQSITSSDMNFELELKTITALPATGSGCTSQEIGCFTSLAASCQAAGIFALPSTHTFQVIKQQGDPYSVGGGNMPTNNDFTAYVPINNSSENGYLSINHENNPGGVSILDMHYNPYTGLWVVDSSRAVSFADVVKSERNCSGGITPWGTVVTSEEAVTGGDANGDGYTDIGWHVEINPATKKIVDHNNDGLGDKLWALGRSNKENICFRTDSLTSYFGLDNGATSYIWKFVANQKADLSSGTLYVLKQNFFLGNTAQWVQVPNATQADQNNATSLATGLGATSFDKVEDVEIGPDGKIYFTSSNAGRVYRFTDSPSITDFEIYIDKQTYTFNTGSGLSSALFNNCDNLSFDPIEGNLWINVDGNCNYLWVAKNGHTSLNPKMEVFGRPPSGAESTGTTFSPDGRFMFVSIQHPSATAVTVVDEAGITYTLNKATTFVIARKEDLGALAAIPFVELGNAVTICQGETTTLDAGAGHASYLWSTGATTQTIDVTVGGTYSVTVTGANGRTNGDAITVNVNTLPTAPVAASPAYCDGQTVSALNATGSSVIWYDDVTLLNQVATGSVYNTGITAVGTHNFYATQTDANGCVSTATPVTLTINPLPVAPSAVNANGCETAIIPSLNATGSNIKWYSDVALTNQVASGNSFATGNTSAGAYTYYATQTNANGCTSAAATTVTLTIFALPATPTITGTNTYCAGETLLPLNATGTNNTWYAAPNHGNLVGTGTVFLPTVTSTTTFYVASSANGCQSIDASVTVTINPLPNAPTGNDISICDNLSVPSLNASGTNVEWYSDAALTANVHSGNTYATGNSTPGTYSYYVTQTDANNCTSSSEEIILTIHSTPVAPVVNGDIEYCAGETMTALTSNGTNVNWYSDASMTVTVNTGNTYQPSNTSTADFYVTQSTANCESAATQVTVVINTLPNVNFTGLASQYSVAASAVTLSGTPAGGTFSGTGINGNQFDPAVAGVGGPYPIVYTYQDPATGCTNSITSFVTVEMNVGIVQLENGTAIQVYPNPASEQMRVLITLNNPEAVELNLFDLSGKAVVIQQKTDLPAGSHSFLINQQELGIADGSYFVVVKSGDQQTSIKVVFVR